MGYKIIHKKPFFYIAGFFLGFKGVPLLLLMKHVEHTWNIANGVVSGIGSLGITYASISSPPLFVSPTTTLKKCVGTATLFAPITSYLTYDFPSDSRLKKLH